MERPSIAEIPPVARTAGFSALSLREPLDGWLGRHAMLGAAAGLLLGTATQVAITLSASPDLAAGAGTRVAGVVLTALGYAGLLLCCGALGAPLLRLRWGRSVAVLASTLVATTAFAAHAVSASVRVVAGSHVTVGALDFFLNSTEHLVEALLGGYRVELALVAAIALGGATVVQFFLRRATRGGRVTAVRTAVAGGVGALAVSSVAALPAAGSPRLESLFRTTPELALVGSLHAEEFESATAVGEDAETSASTAQPRAIPGPSRSTEKLWAVAAAGTRHERPNVLLVMLESVGARRVGYGGYDRPVTPHIDRLARGAVRMRRAWTTATHSNYAQMAILSSLFPRRGSGLDVYKVLDYPRVLFHDFFHAAGYTTATISSQDETWQGMLRFQQTGTATHFRHAHDHDGPLVHMGAERIVPDAITAAEAIAWIDRQPGPWATYVNLQSTHFPYRLPDGVAPKFDGPAITPGTVTYFGYGSAQRPAVENRYDNAVAYVDEQIGVLRGYLERSGQLDRTIWVLTSDHGELFGEHGEVTHGKTLLDGEARVPLLVHYPPRLAPRDDDRPVSTVDVLPTLADLAGIPPHPAFQGESLFSGQDERAAVFMNIQGLRSKDGIVCWPYKLVVGRRPRSMALYDLESDPGETRDLSGERAQLAFDLADTLRVQMGAQMRYHHPKHAELRASRFAPRLLPCPSAASAPR